MLDQESKHQNNRQVSFISKGNEALRAGDLNSAIEWFNKAKQALPELSSLIDFNINYVNSVLEKHSPKSKTVSISLKDEREIYALIEQYKNNRSQNNRIAVYTCIVGDYDSLITPEFLHPDWDYILFTDMDLDGHSNYECRKISFRDPDPVRMARYVKLNSHLVLPEYEYTIWIDGNVLLKGESFISEINGHIESESEIVFRRHPDRNCTYDEIEKCKELKKDDAGIMENQIKKYRGSGFPEKLGLFETNVILRKNCKNVNGFNDAWWRELSSGSRRDQLSVMYAAFSSKIKYEYFKENCDIRNPSNDFYYIYSHSPSAVKSAKKYAPPDFYTLKNKVINSSDNLQLSFEKNANIYSGYSVPNKILSLISKLRLTDSFDCFINELDLIAHSYPELKVQVKWHKMLHLFFAGNRDDLLPLLNDSNDVQKNKFFGFYLKLFKQEFNDSLNPKILESENPILVEYYLSSMNIVSEKGNRADWLNKVFAHYGLSPIRTLNEGNLITSIDELYPAKPLHRHQFNTKTEKVSIVVPAYNAQKTIQTSLYSLLNQSWTNLEIIVVDDCSTDSTCTLVEEITKFDSRVRLIRQERNLGPYVARNLALDNVTGDFFTVADADDWHHPDKILVQATHLRSNTSIVANVACWVRMHDDLQPIRRGNPYFKHLNISSLMIRREDVVKKVGYWNRVRFGGDSEFYKRLLAVFGKDAVFELDAITSIGRVEANSLTNNEFFGYSGYPYGARKEYLEIYDLHHRQSSKEGFFYAVKEDKFPVPKPMNPDVVSTQSSVKIALIGDFRIKATCEVAMGEIESYLVQELAFSIIQFNTDYLDPRSKVDEKFRAFLNEHHVCMSVYGETIVCERVIVLDPDSVSFPNKYAPSIIAMECVFIYAQHNIERSINLNVHEHIDFFGAHCHHHFFNQSAKNKLINSLELNPKNKEKISVFKIQNDDILIVKTSEIDNFVYTGSKINCVVMPCIDLELGRKTAEILISRAGIDLTVVIAFDDLRQGFIKTLNTISARVIARFITYVAQDAFPGRGWLRLAYDSIEQNNSGVLGFNDGKWQGRIASFGMVRKKWVEKFYVKEILSGAYKSHKADNEITVIAKLDGKYIYCPDSVLIEVDYRKDSGGSNLQDDEIFKRRFNSGFGKFTSGELEKYRKEYKVKFEG